MITAEERIKIAREYCTRRTLATENKLKLEAILVANLSTMRTYKSNLGIDMAYMMLLEEGFLPEPHREEAQGYYEKWKRNEAKYKGLERILQSVESKVTLIQSIMRYERENS